MDISITDSSSGVPVVEVRMSVEEFANVLFGSGHRPCDYSWWDGAVDRFGKAVERKNESVWLPRSARGNQALIRSALTVYEVDGWIASDSDADNHHRISSHYEKQGRVEGYIANVGFHRYVEAKEDNP